MPNNVYIYFHITGSPSEPINVQLQTLQMNNKIIYMISCQSKGLWLKKNGYQLRSSFVSACRFYGVQVTAAILRGKHLWDLMPYSLGTFVFVPFCLGGWQDGHPMTTT